MTGQNLQHTAREATKGTHATEVRYHCGNHQECHSAQSAQAWFLAIWYLCGRMKPNCSICTHWSDRLRRYKTWVLNISMCESRIVLKESKLVETCRTRARTRVSKRYEMTWCDTCQSCQQLNEWSKIVWPLSLVLRAPAAGSRPMPPGGLPGALEGWSGAERGLGVNDRGSFKTDTLHRTPLTQPRRTRRRGCVSVSLVRKRFCSTTP